MKWDIKNKDNKDISVPLVIKDKKLLKKVIYEKLKEHNLHVRSANSPTITHLFIDVELLETNFSIGRIDDTPIVAVDVQLS